MQTDLANRYTGKSGEFASLEKLGGDVQSHSHGISRTNCGKKPARSIEGWIVIASGVHEEAQEDNVLEIFENAGPVHSFHLNLDRRTGFAKGYALIEYKEKDNAERAIKMINGTKLLGRELAVDWAFVEDRSN